jgi:hypothetical protein
MFLTIRLIQVVYELHGENLFTKLDIHLGYHQIRMRWEYIPKTTFRMKFIIIFWLLHLDLLMHLQHFKS